MMSRKVWPFILIMVVGGTFWAFKSKGGTDDNVFAKQQKLLIAIGNILEQRHYSPKVIDDSFSVRVFKDYLSSMDPDKTIFLQSDIDVLKKYETTLDDEIHGAPLQFFPAVGVVYEKRINEVTNIYKGILEKPFDFKVDETAQLDGDKLGYPATEQARQDLWRKRLKYMTLERYVDLQDQREKNKKVDSIAKKTDADLEKEARDKVLKTMDRTYTRLKTKLDENEQFSLYVNTITGEMDPHTNYFPPVEKRAFDEDMSRRFFGIGAQLRDEDGGIKIVSLITGGPAWKSGQVQVNDIIMKVAQGSEEPVDLGGFAVTDAVKLIRGNKGTEVKLTLKKADGTIKTVSLIRDEIVEDELLVRSAIVHDSAGKKIGYIYLPEFYADFERPDGNRCSADVAKEVAKLKKENVAGIIIDLRFNGGGSLVEVVQMVGLFIKNGPIVQVKDRNGAPDVWKDTDESVLYDGPLAVMVNELSASASEIFAAAIQDYGRGIIIGSTSTYGKGTVQKNIPIGKPVDFLTGATEYGALKLTFEKFYRINGGSTQLKGVTPDVVIPDSYEYLKFREKDNPSALTWDQIPKSTYALWNQNGYADIVKRADERINKNASFSQIKNNTLWLSKNVDKEYNLNINKYKEEQKLIRNTAKQNTDLAALSKPMKIEPAIVDHDKFYNNTDKGKQDRYQQWLKGLRTDLYIDESVRIVADMANAAGTTTVKR
ncbi:carboxy terminal-processing peptidase [Danxiaibacter flavus]|uniref:Carboxy terminal-processing peptidase n=1 Tax=Danxiaibacter flavus TaxID=3049108 RepID=A0ABV3Z8P3_9BACT|nr:carboxy terminal-processing peptidase [Chitinophagaceae bacterium DXS]